MENEGMEEKIRSRAYELWQRDGSPAGQAERYWEEAQASLEKELVAAAMSPSVAATQAGEEKTTSKRKTSRR